MANRYQTEAKFRMNMPIKGTFKWTSNHLNFDKHKSGPFTRRYWWHW